MRVKCPSCAAKFDVRHSSILKEAERLKEKRGGKPVVADPGAPDDVDGNQQEKPTRKQLEAE